MLDKALDIYLNHPNRLTGIAFLLLLLGAMALVTPYFAIKGFFERAFPHTRA